MKKISIIAGKELRGYLNSPMAYIILVFFLVLYRLVFRFVFKANRL